MRSGLLLPLVLAVACLVAAPAALARGPAYRVVYVEAAGSRAAAAKALRRLAILGRRNGAIEFEAFESRARPGHFVLIEAWRDEQAWQAYAADREVGRIRESLAPLLSAPWDERAFVGLAVGATRPPDQAAASVFVVAHVDVMPRAENQEIAALEALREASRREPGNLRFDVLRQAALPNHFTLVETWTDPKALEAYEQSAATKTFRATLLPIGGCPYDERLYSPLKYRR